MSKKDILIIENLASFERLINKDTRLYKPGEISLLPIGHDAWVVGNEPAVVVDFQGMIDYSKKK